jgi:hypothetical protein
MLSQSTSEMCVLTSETVEVATDPEWALVLLLASRLISTLSSLLIFLDRMMSLILPLSFKVALYSEQWTPVGNNIENWHLNDLVVTGPTEFLATQWGPIDLANMTVKTLWSCELQESYESVPDDGRVLTMCQNAVPDLQSVGLNGIAVSDTKQTVWVSDLFASQIVEISKDDESSGGWMMSGSFPTPALVDNFVYLDGTLHMAAPLKVLPTGPSDWVGSYLVGTRLDDTGTFVVEPALQLSPDFLASLDMPFATSGV